MALAAAPPRIPPSPSALPDELVEEILLRLPPDEPKWLLRASVVCKVWGGAVSHHGFRRRLHELHRTPPVLGFLHNWEDEGVPSFIPTTASAFSLAAPDCRFWRALDCRHGRALFLSKDPHDDELLLLWDPITCSEEYVLVPAAFESSGYGTPTAAVFCAVDWCDHRDCHGGPFFLVFVFSITKYTDELDYVSYACVYSSEADMWGELTWSHRGECDSFSYYSSVTVGSSLLYFMSDKGRILEYDFASHSLNVFDAPNDARFNLMLAEDGCLGVIQDFDPQLKLWSREKSDDTTDARWILSRVICLKNLLPNGALVENSVHVLGFAEGVNVIFVTTAVGLFTIELPSQRVRKVCDDHGFCNLIPVVSFYTPRSRFEVLDGEHHYPSLPRSPTEEEEVGGEEGGGEEDETLEHTQELFHKCKAMEEGNFANNSDSLGHTLDIRAPHHGELPPDCARTFHEYGHALLCKAPEVTGSSGNISNNSPNEESFKNTATTSKDDPGISKGPGEKHGDSEEAGQVEPEDIDPDVAAMMDFEGFGMSKK